MIWSEEEIEKLKDYYKKELSIKEISNILNRTEKAIRNKAYKLGISGRNNWSKKEVKQLVKLYNENNKRGDLNLDDFANKVGRLKSNVCRKAKKLGLTNQNRKLNKEEIDKLKESGKKQWNNLSLKEKLKVKNNLTKMRHKGVNKKIYHCKNCGKKILRYPCENKGKNIFCSLNCKGVYAVKYKKGSVYSNTKSGKREDLDDQYFRSSWEANYARYLNFIGEKWEYEPKEFEFKEIKRGTRFYLPDFYLPDKERYVEIKGWFRRKDKTKLKRFKKYYPEEFEKLILVIEKEFKGKQAAFAKKIGIKNIESYKEIKDKVGGLIENWE